MSTYLTMYCVYCLTGRVSPDGVLCVCRPRSFGTRTVHLCEIQVKTLCFNGEGSGRGEEKEEEEEGGTGRYWQVLYRLSRDRYGVQYSTYVQYILYIRAGKWRVRQGQLKDRVITDRVKRISFDMLHSHAECNVSSCTCWSCNVYSCTCCNIQYK